MFSRLIVIDIMTLVFVTTPKGIRRPNALDLVQLDHISLQAIVVWVQESVQLNQIKLIATSSHRPDSLSIDFPTSAWVLKRRTKIPPHRNTFDLYTFNGY